MTTLETNEIIPSFVPGILTPPPYGEKPPGLLGGYCLSCEAHYFPKPRYCPRCLKAVEQREIGAKGRVHSFTVVRTKAPLGLPEPYSVGYIDLDLSGLRIFCLLDPECIDRLHIGSEVELRVSPLGHDGRGAPRLRPFFTLCGQDGRA